MVLRFAVLLSLIASALSLVPGTFAQGLPTDPKGANGFVERGPGKDVLLPDPAPNPPPAAKPSKVIGWPAGKTPTAPPGFRVTLFAENLQFPRWIYVLPNGDVLVTEAGGAPTAPQRINLYKDFDKDGTPKTHTVFISSDLKRPHGMVLLGNRFYVANTDNVTMYPYQSGQTEITAPGQKIADLPDAGIHTSRALVVSPNGTKFYVGVGSSTDSDVNAASLHEPERAAILEMKLDGSERRVFATGLRNPQAIDFDPETKQLWAVVNERSGLGDQSPPDLFTSVKDGGFYGWPYYYWGKYKETRLNREFPKELPKPMIADYALGGHQAPLGVNFYRGKSFPKPFRGGAFISEHGSGNRSGFAGYKVVFLPFDKGQPKGLPQDFLTGFIANDATSEVYGRPVGLGMMADGSLLVTDDVSGKVWRVSAVGK